MKKYEVFICLPELRINSLMIVETSDSFDKYDSDTELYILNELKKKGYIIIKEIKTDEEKLNELKKKFKEIQNHFTGNNIREHSVNFEKIAILYINELERQLNATKQPPTTI